MPRSYAKLLTAIWADDDFCALDERQQRLYMMLLSQPDLTICGAIAPRFERWAKRAADSTPEGIAEVFASLVATRYVCHDPTTEEALLRTFVRHDEGYKTPNIHKAIITAIGNIESVRLQTIARDELDKAARRKACRTDALTHPEGLAEGIPHPSSQQPAASSLSTNTQQPAASSRAEVASELSPDLDLPPAAAAAVDLLIAHRTITATDPITNAKRYARKIRTNLDPDERRALLAEAETGVSAEVIARRVFGLSEWQTRIAQMHLTKQATA